MIYLKCRLNLRKRNQLDDQRYHFKFLKRKKKSVMFHQQKFTTLNKYFPHKHLVRKAQIQMSFVFDIKN